MAFVIFSIINYSNQLYTIEIRIRICYNTYILLAYDEVYEWK